MREGEKRIQDGKCTQFNHVLVCVCSHLIAKLLINTWKLLLILICAVHTRRYYIICILEKLSTAHVKYTLEKYAIPFDIFFLCRAILSSHHSMYRRIMCTCDIYNTGNSWQKHEFIRTHTHKHTNTHTHTQASQSVSK